MFASGSAFRTWAGVLIAAGVVLFAPSRDVFAQTGSVGWGFKAESPAATAAAAVAERARSVRDTLVPLRAEAGSDVVLREAGFALNGNSRAVRLRGDIDGNDSLYFWAVDTAQGTYRVLKMTGTPADARRVEALLRDKGAGARPADVQRLMAEGESIAARARLRVTNGRRDAAGGAQACGALQLYFCTGGIAVGVATYDPIFIQITDTFTWANWSRDEYNFNPAMGGSCWSNPDTGLSHWFTLSCNGYPAVGWNYLDASTTADYINWDFGSNEEPTFVFELAAVNFWEGWRTWDTFHYDEGEFSTLLFGWSTVYDDHEDCWPLG